jgi:hypothetical protein
VAVGIDQAGRRKLARARCSLAHLIAQGGVIREIVFRAGMMRPMAIDDAPPLEDESHNATRGELARLFIQHKADLGVPHFSDANIAAKVDSIMALMLKRHGRALLASDEAWLGLY